MTLVERAAPAAEGLRKFQDARGQEEVEAARIVRRVARSVRRNRMEWPVRGGPLGVGRTRHDPAVYAMAAAGLQARGITAEFHSLEEHRERTCYAGTLTVTSSYEYLGDKAFVKDVDGEEVRRERIPQTMQGHVERLFPPEEPLPTDPEPAPAGAEATAMSEGAGPASPRWAYALLDMIAGVRQL